MMVKYTKINTLWKREISGKKHGKILRGEYSCPEFANIMYWEVTEKIHGRNTRIEYYVSISNGNIKITDISFLGRTDDSEIPSSLFNYLNTTFTPEVLAKMVNIRFDKVTNIPIDDSYDVTLFGEGYGAKIQSSGGRYSQTPNFRLFDVKVGDWWLLRDDVYDIAKKLGIKSVPVIGILTEKDIVSLVEDGYHKKNFKSVISDDTTLDAEGIVARSHPLVLFRDGKPLMFKLKQSDFNE